MLTGTCVPQWKSFSYGGPQPRSIRFVVRVNGMLEDASPGQVIDRCFLPPTILQIDECDLTLRVNDAVIDMRPLIPCFSVASGKGSPKALPTNGFLPFYLNEDTQELWVYAGGKWVKTK